MGSSGGGQVRKLSIVCLHNAIVTRGIMVTIFLVLLEPHYKPHVRCDLIHDLHKTFVTIKQIKNKLYNSTVYIHRLLPDSKYFCRVSSSLGTGSEGKSSSY